jgi:prevent-host-death family protein
MKRVWQLQEAKNKLSEVVEEALSKGPQVITRRGVEAVVVLSYHEYHRLVASPSKLSEFFRESPLVGSELDLNRDRSESRPDVVL